MKSKIPFVLIFIIFLFFRAQSQTPVPPFHAGVNVTNWFQAQASHQVQFTKYTKTDFENIKSLGCNVIRLPINLHAMTNGKPDYTIDPLFFNMLDQVVDWSEELEIYLILDNHTFDPDIDTSPTVEDILVKVWSQMAAHYKNRSEYLLYEVLNEPHGISDELWGQIQQSAIDAIRAEDSKHTIVVGGAGWNSFNNLSKLPHYTDNNLLYTFHFYDPFLFTHQGASWTDLEAIGGIPFPYNLQEMPVFPKELEGSWAEDLYNNYDKRGNAQYMKQLIDIAVDFRDSRNVPVFCGEFGVYIPYSNNDDRVLWYEIARKYFEEMQIPWTIWDYKGGFGIFNKGGNDMFHYDLNVKLTTALGFSAPEQKEYILVPDKRGFPIYSDFIEASIYDASWSDNHTLNYYSANAPYSGKYCIRWNDAAQYATINFDFKPNKDLSYLLEHNYMLSLKIRGNIPDAGFDVRFVDTKNSETDRPWRIRKTITPDMINDNENWQTINILLKEFKEQGAWEDGNWYDPQGKYDWTAVDAFQIVAENDALNGVELFFDEIKITDTTTGLHEHSSMPSSAYFWFKMYPNPVSEILHVKLQSFEKQSVGIKICNQTGQVIYRNTIRNITNTLHPLTIPVEKWQSGVYFCEICFKTQIIRKKIIVMH